MPVEAWGVVPVAGRDSLPFSLIHGESLVAAAALAVQAAGVTLLDPRVAWAEVGRTGLPVLLHDPLCPLTPVAFLHEALRTAVERSAVVAGYRPVTDTVKEYADGVTGATVDRDALLEITSPIVLPASVVGELDGLPHGEFAQIVEELRRRWPLLLVQAPAAGRRVRGAADLPVLQALVAG